MSLVIFAVGVVIFLITVYGTVVSGGLLLTDRQLDDRPELLDDADLPDDVDREELPLLDRYVDY